MESFTDHTVVYRGIRAGTVKEIGNITIEHEHKEVLPAHQQMSIRIEQLDMLIETLLFLQQQIVDDPIDPAFSVVDGEAPKTVVVPGEYHVADYNIAGLLTELRSRKITATRAEVELYLREIPGGEPLYRGSTVLPSLISFFGKRCRDRSDEPTG